MTRSGADNALAACVSVSLVRTWQSNQIETARPMLQGKHQRTKCGRSLIVLSSGPDAGRTFVRADDKGLCP
jgi:hypothetical protein